MFAQVPSYVHLSATKAHGDVAFTIILTSPCSTKVHGTNGLDINRTSLTPWLDINLTSPRSPKVHGTGGLDITFTSPLSQCLRYWWVEFYPHIPHYPKTFIVPVGWTP